jgi:hypothetical protein
MDVATVPFQDAGDLKTKSALVRPLPVVQRQEINTFDLPTVWVAPPLKIARFGAADLPEDCVPGTLIDRESREHGHSGTVTGVNLSRVVQVENAHQSSSFLTDTLAGRRLLSAASPKTGGLQSLHE